MVGIVIIGAIAVVGIVTFLTPRIKNYVEGSWKTIAESCNAGYHYDDSKGYCVND